MLFSIAELLSIRHHSDAHKVDVLRNSKVEVHAARFTCIHIERQLSGRINTIIHRIEQNDVPKILQNYQECTQKLIQLCNIRQETLNQAFEEYLQIKKYYKLEVNIDTTAELNNYILEGGFPRAVFMDNLADKRRYALSVIEEIFEKDIRRRVRIRIQLRFMVGG